MPADPFITVVVCTYNRVDLLERCLDSLAAQTAPKERFEIVVIDNNSSDATATLLAERVKRQPGLRYAFEPNQGLSHARNRGLAEAKGDYVAYLDDDGLADPDWVSGILRMIREQGPDLVAFGGPYFPFYLVPKPRWFADRFGSWDGGRSIRDYVGGECICGGNMVLRTSVLRELGGFSPEFGMRGTVRAYGEESEVHLKMKRRGLRTLYSPYLPIRHLVKPAQYAPKTLLREAFRAGRNAGQLGLLGTSKVVSAAKIIVTLILFPYYFARYGSGVFLTRLLDGLIPLSRRVGYFFGLNDR